MHVCISLMQVLTTQTPRTHTQGGCVYEPSLGDQYARVEAVTSLRPPGASQGGGADGMTASPRRKPVLPMLPPFPPSPVGAPEVMTAPLERRRLLHHPSTWSGAPLRPGRQAGKAGRREGRQAPARDPRCHTAATMEPSARERVGMNPRHTSPSKREDSPSCHIIILSLPGANFRRRDGNQGPPRTTTAYIASDLEQLCTMTRVYPQLHRPVHSTTWLATFPNAIHARSLRTSGGTCSKHTATRCVLSRLKLTPHPPRKTKQKQNSTKIRHKYKSSNKQTQTRDPQHHPKLPLWNHTVEATHAQRPANKLPRNLAPKWYPLFSHRGRRKATSLWRRISDPIPLLCFFFYVCLVIVVFSISFPSPFPPPIARA